jgi:hypothetical protein
MTLGPGDSAGPPLPVLGILEVRLDGGGTAPGGRSLAAEATAVSGGSTRIVLTAG